MLKVTAEMVKEVRDQSGAGVMDCRNALLKAEGDLPKALQLLKEQNLITVTKKASRATTQGVIDAYVHTGEHLGALVELSCETDFVARTGEFRELAHNLAMQVAALAPRYISEADIPEGGDTDPKAACLLLQPYIREPTRTIQDIIAETIAKTGENIKVKRFVRFELGSES